jgi:hypothetical protein
MLNDHVENRNRNNSQKNLHTFGRLKLTTSRAKRCHPGRKSCQDQLMISKAMYEDCWRRKENLIRVWIDYQKAFDNVPHSWVE